MGLKKFQTCCLSQSVWYYNYSQRIILLYYLAPPPMKDSPVTCLASEGTLILSGHEDGCVRLFNESLKVCCFLLSNNIKVFLKVLMVSSNQGPTSGANSKDDDLSVSIEAVAFISRFVKCNKAASITILCPVTS